MCGRCCDKVCYQPDSEEPGNKAATAPYKQCPFHRVEREQAHKKCVGLLKIARMDDKNSFHSKKQLLRLGSHCEKQLKYAGDSLTVFCFADWLSVPEYSESTLELQRQRARRCRGHRGREPV